MTVGRSAKHEYIGDECTPSNPGLHSNQMLGLRKQIPGSDWLAGGWWLVNRERDMRLLRNSMILFLAGFRMSLSRPATY